MDYKNLQAGDIVFARNSEESFVVEKFLAQGGQGQAWKVVSQNTGTAMALKTYELGSGLNKSVLTRVERLIDLWQGDRYGKYRFPYKDPQGRYEFAIPCSWLAVEDQTNMAGHFMAYMPGIPWEQFINQVAVAVQSNNTTPVPAPILDALVCAAHGMNALYRPQMVFADISYSNLKVSMEKDRVTKVEFIDCENITYASDDQIAVKGTGWFMAPEVAYGKGKVGYYSDAYALAYLCYDSILCYDQSIVGGRREMPLPPFGGAKDYCVAPDPFTMAQEGEKESRFDRFIFSPQELREGQAFWDKEYEKKTAYAGLRERAFQKWQRLPQKIQDLFICAFDDPFDEEKAKHRPTPAEWIIALEEMRGNSFAVTRPLAPLVQTDLISKRVSDGTITLTMRDLRRDTQDDSPVMTIGFEDDGLRVTNHAVRTLHCGEIDLTSGRSIKLPADKEIVLRHEIAYDNLIKIRS